MSPAVSTHTVVELHFENGDGKVLVFSEDCDLMAMSVETAIEACRAFDKKIEFKRQLDLLLPRLAAWVRAHAEKLAEAYLTTRDSGLLFVAVTNDEKFDSAFEEQLSELDLDVANDSDFELINLNVHALPKCSPLGLRSFLSDKMTLRFSVHGKRK